MQPLDHPRIKIISCISQYSLHEYHTMYILTAIVRSGENSMLRNLKEKTRTSDATDIFGPGENVRLMNSEESVLMNLLNRIG